MNEYQDLGQVEEHKPAKRTYKFIDKLIDKVTTSKSNNMHFTYYGHLVELSSGTRDYVSVTIYNTNNHYEGEMASFSYDYWTHELHFCYSECKALTERIINVFKAFYSFHHIHISYNETQLTT